MNETRLYTARHLLPILAPPVEDGALCVRGGRIVAAGRRDEVRRLSPGAACTDFGEAILLPTMVNAHTHLELTHFPDWAAEGGEEKPCTSFVDWILQVVRVKRGLAPDRYLPSLREGIRRSLRAGTGAVGDILSWFPAREGFAGSPLRGRLFFETLGQDPERTRRVLANIEEELEGAPAGCLESGISPHSPYTLSSEFLEEVIGFARRREVPLCTHLAESAEETRFLGEAEGPLAERFYPFVGWGDHVPPPSRLSPVAYLAARGGLVRANLLVHGVQVAPEDVRRIADSGACVVLCPRSNARLGVGVAPIDAYLSAGVPLALGTDSLASCDSLSLWDELAFARSWWQGRVDPQRLLTMATAGGARALGLASEMGALLPGSGAHFQVLRPPLLPAARELTEFLCTPGRTEEVAHLYLDGREVLLKD